MIKLMKFLKSRDFAFFLTLFFLILFSWPIVTIFDQGQPVYLFTYLFIVWFIGIVLLFFMGRVYLDSTSDD